MNVITSIRYITSSILGSCVLGGIFLFPFLAAASSTNGTIDSTSKYAWGENIGWVNFGTSEGNVHVTDSGMTGYAWAENIGWISLNCSNDSSCGTVSYGVSADSAGTLSGYAWSENAGWISFNPTGGGVTIGSTGAFSGYAWGENIGWIVFNCSTTNSCGTVDYRVQTDWQPPNTRSGSSGSSGGSGGTVVVRPSLTVVRPESGRVYAAGNVTDVSWIASGGAYSAFRITYSLDGGSAWSVLAGSVSGTLRTFSWMVPGVTTERAYIRVEGFDAGGALLAADITDSSFKISGGSTVVSSPIPGADPTAVGTYDRFAAQASTPDIDTDKGLVIAINPPCTGGTLIKASGAAVYYCGKDGKRYIFPNEKIYFSWYPDFSGVQKISDAVLASVPIGGNVTYRPGMRLIKITTDPKVYAVSRGGLLRWVTSETVAKELFGADWNRQIDDVSDAFFVNYQIGAPIP